jgi:hypothetical protein
MVSRPRVVAYSNPLCRVAGADDVELPCRLRRSLGHCPPAAQTQSTHTSGTIVRSMGLSEEHRRALLELEQQLRVFRRSLSLGLGGEECDGHLGSTVTGSSGARVGAGGWWLVCSHRHDPAAPLAVRGPSSVMAHQRVAGWGHQSGESRHELHGRHQPRLLGVLMR